MTKSLSIQPILVRDPALFELSCFAVIFKFSDQISMAVVKIICQRIEYPRPVLIEALYPGL